MATGDSNGGVLSIDEHASADRRGQFEAALAALASIKRSGAVSGLLGLLLGSRSVPGRTRSIEAAISRDVIEFLCWLDVKGSGHAVVHTVDCAAVGTSSL